MFVAAAPLLDAIDQPKNAPSIRKGRLITIGVLLSLLTAVRPDGALYTAILIGVLLTSGGLSKRAISWSLLIGILPALSWLVLAAFRYWYYGDFVPNTAYAKLAFSPYHMSRFGIRYLLRGYGLLFPLALVIPVLCFWSQKIRWYRARIRFLTASIVLWSLYLLVIGGDVDPPSRHFMPILIFQAFMITGLFSIIREKNPALVCRGNFILFLLGFSLYGAINFFEAEVRDARAPLNQFDDNNEIKVGFARVLKTAFKDCNPLMAVYAAGLVPFYTEFRSIDMLGLNDRHIARHPPKDFGTGWIAHELSDPDYVFSRKPDLIVQGGVGPGCGWRACLEVTKNFLAHPELARSYVRARLTHSAEPVSDGYFWVRRDGNCGWKMEEDELTIPAILANADGAVSSHLDSSLRITSIITAQTPIKLASLPLRHGTWEVSFVPPNQPFSIQSSSCEISADSRTLNCRDPAVGTPDHTVEVVPESATGELSIRSIVFKHR